MSGREKGSRTMKIPRRVALVILVAALAGSLSLPALAVDPNHDVPGEILVELAPGASPNAVAQRYGLALLDGIAAWQIWLMAAPSGANVAAITQAMASDPDIASAETHHRYEIPEGVQRTIADLDRSISLTLFRNQPAAALLRTAAAHAAETGNGVVVALLDTGVSLDHPELKPWLLGPGLNAVRLEGGDATVRPNGLDDDGDGLVDEALYHGTFVAGLINLAAPHARILPIRVLDEEGYGTGFSLAKGILEAIHGGARVINLSLTLEQASGVAARALREAHAAGVVIVGAAGNRDLSSVDFPASHDKVIAVAAVNEAKVRTPFSNYSSKVDLSAPGETEISIADNETFARWSGTSFAAPLVTGGAALLLERYPGLGPDDVRRTLRDTTQPDANLQDLDGKMGTGVLDLDALAHVVLSDRTSLKLRRGPAGSVVSWSPVLNATGYDLVRGNVADISANWQRVDLGPVTCLADSTAATDTAASPDAALPPPGQAFYYVFRDDASVSNPGSYGTDSAGRSRTAGSGDCAAR